MISGNEHERLLRKLGFDVQLLKEFVIEKYLRLDPNKYEGKGKLSLRITYSGKGSPFKESIEKLGIKRLEDLLLEI